MSERGYICLDRGALDHEFFNRKEHSEFEAWVWLLTEAAWKPRSRRLGDFMVTLKRGELVASFRHMMRVWGWSKGKVERFVARLKTETMIETHTATGISVITICNYDKYQIRPFEVGTPSGTPAGTEAGQKRDTNGDNTETIKHLNKETGIGAPAKRRRKAGVEIELPSDFSLDERNVAIAAVHGFVGANAIRLFDKFTSSAKARGRTYVDWPAAWRVWCANQAQWDAERLAKSPARGVPRI